MRSGMLKAIEDKFEKLCKAESERRTMLRTIVREEIEAHGERQPKLSDLSAGITQNVRASVLHVIKATPRVRNVDQMSKEKVADAIGMAVGVKTICELLPHVLSRRSTAIALEATTPNDVCTISFPAAIKKRVTYSNTEFDKIVK